MTKRDPLAVIESKIPKNRLAEAKVIKVHNRTRTATVNILGSNLAITVDISAIDPNLLKSDRSRLLVYVPQTGTPVAISTIPYKMAVYPSMPTVTLGDVRGGSKLYVKNSAGTEKFFVDSRGIIGMADGMPAPSAESGWATLYVDSADSQLKLKHGDGSVVSLEAASSPHAIDGAMHSGTGSTLDLVGFSATDTLDVITPSYNTGASAKVLRTDADGMLRVNRLGVASGSPTAVSPFKVVLSTDGTYLVGNWVQVTSSYTGSSFNEYWGLYMSLSSQDDITHTGGWYGINLAISHAGAANIDYIHGLRMSISGATFGGTITDGYYIRLNTVGQAGKFTNIYGIHIADLTGAATASWALYSTSSAASYHEGALGLGSSTVSSAKLHVLDDATQLRLSYDASNYAEFDVGSGGALTITSTLGYTLTDKLSVNGTLMGDEAALQVQLTTSDSIVAYGIQTKVTPGAAIATGYGIEGTYYGDTYSTTTAVGVEGRIQTEATIGTAIGIRSLFTSFTGGSVTDRYGIAIGGASISGGSVTNNYGLYIYNQNTGGTLNYAIYTNAGKVRLGDQTEIYNTQSSSSTVYGLYTELTNTSTGIPYGGNFIANVQDATAPNMAAIYARARITPSTAAATISSGQSGVLSRCEYNISSSYNATILTGAAFRAGPPYKWGAGGGTLAVTNQIGLYVENQGHSDATNAYGLYIDSQSGAGTSNYAIYAAGGLVRIDQDVRIGGGLYVGATGTDPDDGDIWITGEISTDGTGSIRWDFGGYNTTPPSATGYVELTINGTTYKLLAST